MLNYRLFSETRNKKLYMPIVILSPILNSIFIVVSAYILATIVNDVFIRGQTLNTVSIYLVLFLLTAIIKVIINFFIEVYIKNCSEDIKENIKKKSFRSIISANAYKIKQEKLGDIIKDRKSVV